MKEHNDPLLRSSSKIVNEPFSNRALKGCVLRIRVIGVVREKVGVDSDGVDVSDINRVVVVVLSSVVRHVETVQVPPSCFHSFVVSCSEEERLIAKESVNLCHPAVSPETTVIVEELTRVEVLDSMKIVSHITCEKEPVVGIGSVCLEPLSGCGAI